MTSTSLFNRRPPALLPSRLRATARVAALVVGCLLAVAPTANAEDRFPLPPELERDVAFWVRIYSEVDTKSGLIHDSRDLGVVYDVIRFPSGASARSRERQVERRKKELIKALKTLASGRRSGLSTEAQRILALFPPGVGDRTLADAARHVRFQLGQADKFRAGIVRSGAWRGYIRTTFREMGLPTELSALPHVESSFTPSVYSRVGAAGLWQFTRSTGRRYMRVDHVVDERLDPFKATVAAARLLEANRLITGSWPLAITAYNHGAAGMRRAARKLGTTDIATIARKYKSRSFGFASRNFYVEFLAAKEVDAHSERYFGPLVLNRPVDYDRYELGYFAKARSLADATGVSVDVLRQSNPALSRLVWSGEKFVPRGFELRVPRSRLAKPLESALATIPADARYATQTADSTHKVRRGDTLSGIAARYGTSVRKLSSMNKLRSRNRISVGQVLRLPHDGRASRVARPATPAVAAADGTYTVRRGDSVARIAARFGMSEQQLVRMNSLRNRNRIHPGQKLQVVATAPVAAAETPPPTPPTPTAVVAPPPASRPALAPAAPPEPEPVAVVARAEPPTQAAQPKTASPRTATVEILTSVAGAEPEAARDVLTADADTAAFDVEPEAVAAVVADGVAEDEARGEALAALPAMEAMEAVEATGAVATVEATDGELQRDLLADPSDYSVADDRTIEVQAAETLGHIAEWLDVRASRLRSINRLRFGSPLVIHRRLQLDFTRVEPAEFERRRLEHHRAVQAEYFERYEISGTRAHVVRRGDSLWVLSKQSQVPLWLLQQYNPDLDFGSLRKGARVTLPVVRRHGDAA